MNDPDDPTMLEQHVAHMLERHHYREAEVAARSLLVADPQESVGHRMLAQALHGLRRDGEAVERAVEACRLDADDVSNMMVLADCATAAGRHTLAVDSARRAVALAPHSWATHYTLGHALLAAPDLDRRRAAAAVIDEAERLAPASPDVHDLRGMLLNNLGDARGARAAYERALALDPHSSTALNNLAALDVRRRPGRSARLLSSAAAIDPQQRVIQENLSTVAWNILVSVYRALFWSAFLVAGSRELGAPPWMRAVILLGVGSGLVWWASRRLRHLPRGYRTSPRVIWRGFDGYQKGTALGLVVALALMGVVVFAPSSAAGFGWFGVWVLGLLMWATHKRR